MIFTVLCPTLSVSLTDILKYLIKYISHSLKISHVKVQLKLFSELHSVDVTNHNLLYFSAANRMLGQCNLIVVEERAGPLLG